LLHIVDQTVVACLCLTVLALVDGAIAVVVAGMAIILLISVMLEKDKFGV
jgi:hypothetical protein